MLPAALRSLGYGNLLWHTEGRVVVDTVHLLAYADRDVVGLALLQASDGVGGVVCSQHDFRLSADHVFPLAVLEHVAVPAGGFVILDGHLARRRVLHGADDDRLEPIHHLGI